MTSLSPERPKSPRFIRVILRIIDSPGAFILLALLFRVALEIGYVVYVHPNHAYAGFAWDLDLLKYVESWVFYLIMLMLAPKQVNRPSDLFLAILLFGLMVPLLSMYGIANHDRIPIYIITFGYALVALFRRGRPFQVHCLREGPLLSRSAVLIGAIGVSLWFVISGAFTYFQLDLTDVYEYRRAVGQQINVGLMGYVNNWAYNVFGPTLLALALWRRSWPLAVVALGFHVFWFGVSGHKAVLFYPLPVVFLWWWLRRTRALSVVPLALTGVVLGATLIHVWFDYNLAASLFVRRVFYTLANNAFDYYEFFGSHQFVWWSNSLTAWLFEYPYDVNSAVLIGEWRGSGGHINNTFLSTGFMHAGILGIALYGTAAGLLFRLIDSLAYRGIPLWVALSVMIISSRSLLLSADLPTSLATHGIAIGLVVLFLLRSRGWERFSEIPKGN